MSACFPLLIGFACKMNVRIDGDVCVVRGIAGSRSTYNLHWMCNLHSPELPLYPVDRSIFFVDVHCPLHRGTSLSMTIEFSFFFSAAVWASELYTPFRISNWHRSWAHHYYYFYGHFVCIHQFDCIPQHSPWFSNIKFSCFSLLLPIRLHIVIHSPLCILSLMAQQ